MKNRVHLPAPAAALLATLLLGACGTRPAPPPTSAQIEALGMAASQQGQAAAEFRLVTLAREGLPVAERELALLYRPRPAERAEALRLFEHAARAGDTEAAFQLGEMHRVEVAGMPATPAQAWPWYRMAAERGHARAALILGLLAKNGEGVPRDAAAAAQWLTRASELGDGHAMFLLSQAYAEGRGVQTDAARARALLEEAAEHEYPPALQELALAVQLGDAHGDRDELRASHLLKEANEHRHNNWNTF